MLKGLTSTFKNGCNNVEVMYREYLVLGNQTIPIKAELSDDSYENGNFIGTFIFKTIKFETDAQYDFKNKEFEYYKEVNGESVKIGTFITTEVEINDTTEIVKVVGMDYGLKTQVAYRSQLDYSARNITLLDVWNEACQLSGLESGIDYFPNGDFIVDNDQFTGTGATIRDVFKGIAMSSGSFVKVMNDDKVYLVFNSYTGDTETATINGSGSIDDGYAIDNLQIEGKVEQEGTPTPDNPEEIKTVSGIGNLFDINSTPFISRVAYNSSGVQQNWNNYSGTTIKTPIQSSTTYTITEDKNTYTTYIVEYNSSETFIQRTVLSNYNKTFTTSSNTKYINISVSSEIVPTKVQIEEGTTAHTPVPYGHWLPIKIANSNDTSAEDYQEQTTLIDLNIYDENNNIIGNYELSSSGDDKDLLTIKDGNATIYKNTEAPPETINLRGEYNINLYEGVNHISIEDELEPTMVMSYYNDNLDVIEDYVELEDKRDTHPWTCLRLGMSQVEGENVDYIDEDLVAKYGENWLILNDNPFAYTQQKRQQLITNIFNRIKKFGYSAFVSKTSFKPYLTAGDIVKFRNRDGNLTKTIVLRYNHNAEEITLESPSETSATVNYVYPLTDIDLYKRTEIQVDKANGDIKLLTDTTANLQDSMKNVYTIEQVNDLIVNAETGVTNTFSKAGGNNIFRNTGLWFEQSDDNNPYEFWTGKVVREREDKASNRNALKLQNATLSQEQYVPNGDYTVSFIYKKLETLATVKVKINGVEYELMETDDTEFEQHVVVNSQNIKIEFICDVNNGCEIYDLMVNAGEVKLAYSQNQNETTTDTVNISKGITITSSDLDVKFKADADGIRTLDSNNNELTKFTDKGMTTEEAIINNKSQIVGTLWQQVGEQTWITRM